MGTRCGRHGWFEIVRFGGERGEGRGEGGVSQEGVGPEGIGQEGVGPEGVGWQGVGQSGVEMTNVVRTVEGAVPEVTLRAPGGFL